MVTFKNLQKRATTGLFLALVFLVIIFLPFVTSWGGQMILVLAALAVGAVGSEVYLIVSHDCPRGSALAKMALWLFGPLVTFIFVFMTFGLGLHQLESVAQALLLLSLWLTFMSLLAVVLVQFRGDLAELFRPLSEDILAWSLVSVGGSCLIALSFWGQNSLFLLWLVATVAFNDMGAYFGGSTFGGAKLAEVVSPGKTVSGGVFGGMIGTVVGILLGLLIFSAEDLATLSILSLSVVVSAQVGDLTKSVLKRSRGVKDSGSILPGHGGVLDRIDGMLFGSVPTLIFVSQFGQIGGVV